MALVSNKKVLALLIIPVLFIALVAGQDMRITFYNRKVAAGVIWEFKGATTLPPGTWLIAKLRMQDTTRILDLAHFPITTARFRHRCGPIASRVPSGIYIWQLSKRDGTIVHTFEFRVGTPHDQRREIGAAAKFYQNILSEIKQTTNTIYRQNQLRATRKKILNEPKKYARQMHHKLQDLRSKLQQRDSAVWFNRFRGVTGQIYAVIAAVNRLWHLHNNDFTQLLPAEKRNKTMRSCRKIAKRLPIAANFDEQELKCDLQWFNRIFQDMERAYQRRGFVEQKRDKIVLLRRELADFRRKAADYRNSPVQKKYNADIAAELMSLANYCGRVLNIYISAAKATHKAKKVKRKLRETFAKLYAIVITKRDADEKARQVAQNKITHIWTLFKELHTRFLRVIASDKSDNFYHWSKLWEIEARKLEVQIVQLKKHFPQLHIHFYVAIQRMHQRLHYGRDNNTTIVYRCEKSLQVILQQLQVLIHEKQ